MQIAMIQITYAKENDAQPDSASCYVWQRFGTLRLVVRYGTSRPISGIRRSPVSQLPDTGVLCQVQRTGRCSWICLPRPSPPFLKPDRMPSQVGKSQRRNQSIQSVPKPIPGASRRSYLSEKPTTRTSARSQRGVGDVLGTDPFVAHPLNYYGPGSPKFQWQSQNSSHIIAILGKSKFLSIPP